MRLRLTQNNSTFTKQNPNQNFIHVSCTKFDSKPTSRVHLTQSQLKPAQQFNIFKSNTPNHHISDCDFDPLVRFTHNKLTLAGHNLLLFNQSYIPHNSNDLFATHTIKHIKLNLNSHRTVQLL